MRVLAIVAGGLALILIGCGSSAVSSPPASETPTPSPSQAVMRNLKTGEDVALDCGLTLTVPADYHGYYAAGEPGSDAPLDFVASERGAQTSLMHSFSAQSFASTSTLGPNGLSWPLVASSGDGTVEVHSDAIRLGTPKAVSMISVVIHLPDRPAGQVSMMVYGEKASDATDVVLEQVNSMWTLFAVQGVALPSTSQ